MTESFFFRFKSPWWTFTHIPLSPWLVYSPTGLFNNPNSLGGSDDGLFLA